MTNIDIQTSLNECIESYNAGQMQQAKELCHKILEEDPENVTGLYLLGTIYGNNNNNNEKAKELISKVIQIIPEFPDAYLKLAIIFQEQGNLSAAIENYHKAISLKPENHQAIYNLGVALQEQGNLQEAIKNYKKAIAIKPDYHQAFYNLGISLQEQGDFREAIENYKKAIAIKPDYHQAFYNLGNALKEQGHLLKAIESYKKAIAIKPDYHQAFYNLCNILQNNNYLKDATHLHRNKKFQQLKDLVKINNALLLPPIYKDKKDLLHWRKRLYKNVRKGITDNWKIHQSQLSSVLGIFYLVYQGYNNKKINSYIAQMLSPSVPAAVIDVDPNKIDSELQLYNHFEQKSTKQKIKIGFISTFFHAHSVTDF